MARSSEASPRRRPHFFKIFFPELCGQKLGIPQKFWRHIDVRTHRTVSLKGPSGDVWNVELVRDANGISLRNGWEDFVKDHSLSSKDVLLFRYEGYLQFTVFIFGKNACEKEDSFSVSTSQDLVVLGDSSARQKAIVCLVDDIYDSPPSMESNGTVAIVDASKYKTKSHGSKLSPSSPIKTKWRGSRCVDEPQCSKQSCTFMQMLSVSEIDVKLPLSIIKEEPIEFLAPSTPKNTTNSSDKKGTCRKRKSKEPKPSIEKPITSVDSKRKKVITCAIRPKKGWSKLDIESRQVLVKARMGKLISNRRSVIEDEVRKAQEAARLFTSKNPTTLVVMRECYVYFGFYLSLPTNFVRQYLPESTQEMELLDPNGKVWNVNYVVHLGFGGISAHWGAFSLANNLEKDDVCVFELIAKAAMKVHIFRVVDELKPLTHLPFNEECPLLMLENVKNNIT